MHFVGENTGASPPSTALVSLEICEKTRAEQGGWGQGRGVGEKQPAERTRFILPVGFACCDQEKKPFETARDVARSHTQSMLLKLQSLVRNQKAGWE